VQFQTLTAREDPAKLATTVSLIGGELYL